MEFHPRSYYYTFPCLHHCTINPLLSCTYKDLSHFPLRYYIFSLRNKLCSLYLPTYLPTNNSNALFICWKNSSFIPIVLFSFIPSFHKIILVILKWNVVMWNDYYSNLTYYCPTTPCCYRFCDKWSQLSHKSGRIYLIEETKVPIDAAWKVSLE